MDIQKHPQAFTFAHHLEGGSGYSDEFLERYRQRFLAEWGDDGGLYPEKVQADRAELMKLTRDVIDWADQVIAHSYPREQRPALVTYGDLDRAIYEMTGTYNRYRELLTATSIVFEGTAIDPAWVTTFDRPLFPHPRFEGSAESMTCLSHNAGSEPRFADVALHCPRRSSVQDSAPCHCFQDAEIL